MVSQFPWLSLNLICRSAWSQTQMSACLGLPSVGFKSICHHHMTSAHFNLKNPPFIVFQVSLLFCVELHSELPWPTWAISLQVGPVQRPFESCGKPENGISQEMQLHLGKSKNWPHYREEMVLQSFRYLNPGLNHTEGGATDQFHQGCGSQRRTSDVLLYPSTFSFRNKVCQSTWSWAGDQTPQ